MSLSAVVDIEQNPLRIYRKKLGMTHDQLARALGVSKPSIRIWESGGGMPGWENSIKLEELEPGIIEALRKWRTG